MSPVHPAAVIPATAGIQLLGLPTTTGRALIGLWMDSRFRGNDSVDQGNARAERKRGRLILRQAKGGSQ
jgi:hypothetical protein